MLPRIRPLLAPFLLALVAVACAQLPRHSAAPTPHPSNTTTLILTRHAEKADQSKDPDLSDAGRRRSARLAQALSDSGVDTVYFSDLRRTRQSAAEVIESRRIAADRQREYSHKLAAAELAAKLRQEPPGHVILFIGHSDMIPGLLNELGHWQVGAMADSDYDGIFIVTLDSGGGTRLLRAGYPPAKGQVSGTQMSTH